MRNGRAEAFTASHNGEALAPSDREQCIKNTLARRTKRSRIGCRDAFSRGHNKKGKRSHQLRPMYQSQRRSPSLHALGGDYVNLLSERLKGFVLRRVFLHLGSGIDRRQGSIRPGKDLVLKYLNMLLSKCQLFEHSRAFREQFYDGIEREVLKEWVEDSKLNCRVSRWAHRDGWTRGSNNTQHILRVRR
jgi:hypothetical protein